MYLRLVEIHGTCMSGPRSLEHRTQALVFLISRVWVRVPVLTLVSLSKTLDHYCFVLLMGSKAVGPVCCVLHVKEPNALSAKNSSFCRNEKGTVWQQFMPQITLYPFPRGIKVASSREFILKQTHQT